MKVIHWTKCEEKQIDRFPTKKNRSQNLTV